MDVHHGEVASGLGDTQLDREPGIRGSAIAAMVAPNDRLERFFRRAPGIDSGSGGHDPKRAVGVGM